MRKPAIYGALALVIFVVLGTAVFRRTVRPVVTSPFAIQPVILNGIDVPNPGMFARYNGGQRTPDTVYILGVFRGGNVLSREEITHKINAEELVALLTNTIAVRSFPFVRGPAGQRGHYWSIYLHQNRDMHLMLWGRGTGALMVSGSEIRSLNIISGAGALEAVLERMATDS